MDWLAIIYTLALAAVVAVVPLALVRRWLRERSSRHGLDVFKGVGILASRQLKAENVQMTWLSYEYKGTHESTRVSIAHSARLPYVVLLSGNKVVCYDKKGYEDWTGQGGDPRCVPLPAQQLCDLGLLQRLQSVPGLDEVAGPLIIEPSRIVALEDSSRLSPAYAARVATAMLRLAEAAEKPSFAMSTPRPSPATS